MKNIFAFVFSLFYRFLIKPFYPEKVLVFSTGWDTLPTLANFSCGGLSKKRFLALLRANSPISAEDYYRALYGKPAPDTKQVLEKIEKGNKIKKYFYWKK